MEENKPNHIMLTGSVGVGKTLISKRLTEALNMPVVSIDIFRFIEPNEDMERLKRRKLELEDKERVRKELKSMSAFAGIFSLKTSTELKDTAELEQINRHLELRELAPNARNIVDLGYDNNFVNGLYKKFGRADGEVLALLYAQPYINQMTQEIIEELKVPCIIDASGGQYYSYNYDYELKIILDKYFKNNNITPSAENVPEEINIIRKNTTHGQSVPKAITNVVNVRQSLLFMLSNDKAKSHPANLVINNPSNFELLESLNPLIVNNDKVIGPEFELNEEELQKNVKKIVNYYNRPNKKAR